MTTKQSSEPVRGLFEPVIRPERTPIGDRVTELAAAEVAKGARARALAGDVR